MPVRVEAVLQAHTQTVSLSWRVELRFYEVKVAILRALEKGGQLKAFRVREDMIDARLSAQRHQLTVRSSGLTMKSFAPESDPDDFWGTVALAYDMLSPARPHRVEVNLTHVVPLDAEDMEEAVERAYGRVLLQPGSGIKLGDWAILSNFELPGGDPEAEGWMEFGLVTPEEVPERLARTVGRMGAGASGSGLGEQRSWRASEFKPVSLFADTNVTTPLQSEDYLETARSFWQDARREVSSLVGAIHEKLSDDQGGDSG